MFDTLTAFNARTLGQAEAALEAHIRANLRAPREEVWKHSKGFDLYLPWFLELIEDHRPVAVRENLPINQLQRLYMDAAWDMVMKGVLRPGPKTISSDAGGQCYGKGFSLTARGRERLAHSAEEALEASMS